MEFIDLIILRFYGYTDDTEIGDCYYYGKHVNQNIEIAKRYYNKAINNSDPRAFFRLSDIEKIAGKLAESSYLKARAFEILRVWDAAITFYSDAGGLNHIPSMRRLIDIYKCNRLENETVVINANMEERLYWYRKAIINNCKESLAELTDLSNSEVKAALLLVEMYEKRETRNRYRSTKIIEFLIKASRLNDTLSSHRLGMIYENGLYNQKINLTTSFCYYIKSGANNHKASLKAIENFIDLLEDDKYRYKLAIIYHRLADIFSSKKHFKILSDSGFQDPSFNSFYTESPDKKIENIIDNNSIDFERKYISQAKAALNSPEEFSALESAASSGIVEAIYALGYHYWLTKKEIFKALDCLILAACGLHKAADCYLRNTKFTAAQYIYIANTYEKGTSKVKIDLQNAIYFYLKAFELNDKDAAFQVGSLYLVLLDQSSKYSDITYDNVLVYFIFAAQHGRKDALTVLERLGDEVSASGKAKLGDLYANPPCNNIKLAQKWYQSAAVDGDKTAEKQLQQLKRNTSKNNNSFFFERNSEENLNIRPQDLSSSSVRNTLNKNVA